MNRPSTGKKIPEYKWPTKHVPQRSQKSKPLQVPDENVLKNKVLQISDIIKTINKMYSLHVYKSQVASLQFHLNESIEELHKLIRKIESKQQKKPEHEPKSNAGWDYEG